MPSRARWAAAGCISGLSMWGREQEPTCPFHNHPRLSVKCQQAREGGGGETGKLLTRKMLGRGWCRPRLPDSYFGMCYDGVQPWQGRGLSVGALNWHSARREEKQISANRGREFWVKWGPLSSSGIHRPQAIQGPLNPLSEYSSLAPKRSQMYPSSPDPAIKHPDGFFSGLRLPTQYLYS